jgi:hypothetical protein
MVERTFKVGKMPSKKIAELIDASTQCGGLAFYTSDGFVFIGFRQSDDLTRLVLRNRDAQKKAEVHFDEV